jgi:hypothetical protein
MMKSRTYRPLHVVLTLLLALVGALAALALTEANDATARGSAAHAAGGRISTEELALRNEMRKLWEDHITWTRVAIISLTTDAPDTEASVGRLIRNQADIGNALEPFYGEAAGAELTRLLREHITIAAELIAAAKSGDEAELADAQARWKANADQIAVFLHEANPRNWPLESMKGMLREHLRLTTQEVLSRLQGDWAADVAAYDEIHVQALDMADMLSSGLVKQFPRRFR